MAARVRLSMLSGREIDTNTRPRLPSRSWRLRAPPQGIERPERRHPAPRTRRHRLRQDQRLRAAVATLASKSDEDRAPGLPTHLDGRANGAPARRARESSTRRWSLADRVRRPGTPLHGPPESSRPRRAAPTLGPQRRFRGQGSRFVQPMASTEGTAPSIVRSWLLVRQLPGATRVPVADHESEPTVRAIQARSS